MIIIQSKTRTDAKIQGLQDATGIRKTGVDVRRSTSTPQGLYHDPLRPQHLDAPQADLVGTPNPCRIAGPRKPHCAVEFQGARCQSLPRAATCPAAAAKVVVV